MFQETKKLRNGVEVPQLALGTWLMDDALASIAVQNALKIGYRHIDTAQAYQNEHGIGDAIRKSGIAREDVFVTSKIAAEYKTYEEAKASIEKTLEDIGLDYLDLMLIHSPQPWNKVNQSSYRYFKENRAVWRALEDAYKEGKFRAIGVSNFQIDDIENIWNSSEIKPMVNQILCHISNSPLDLIESCQKKDMVIEAYSPIAHGEALKNREIDKIAKKYDVTIPQLCIRYDIQLGMIVLPKAKNPEHMKTNASIDFLISKEDMDTLKHIERIKDYGEHSFFPVFGGKL